MPSYSTSRTTQRWKRAGYVCSAAVFSAALAAGIGAMLSVTVHGQASPPAAATPAQTPRTALTGNLQELMRGVFFPTANQIFNVQTHDPVDKKPTTTQAQGSGTENFDWVKWGAGLYSGWEDVTYASIILTEVSPLLLTPGRTCQNGNPVPVTKPDWIKFTTDMIDAARKSYEAAKTKNMEAVSDSTNDLNDACQQCHRVYRRGDPQTPSSQRCLAP